MTDNSVSVAGWSIDKKVAFIEYLWKHRTPASFFKNIPNMAPSFNASEAKYWIESGHLDYICGRRLKIYTDTDNWNMDLFDQDPDTNAKKGHELYQGFIQLA
jgi:hypothetical protein